MFDGRKEAGQSVGGLTAVALTPNKQMTPIEAAWHRLEEEVNLTSNLINALYGRLRPVLTPEGPSDATGTQQGQPPVSPIAESAFGIGDKVASSNAALRRLLDRLEI